MKGERPQQPLTTEQHVRLELLKLLHVHSKDEQTLIDRAAKLEQYVVEGAKDEKPPQP
jgi:hypothetical protein